MLHVDYIHKDNSLPQISGSQALYSDDVLLGSLPTSESRDLGVWIRGISEYEQLARYQFGDIPHDVFNEFLTHYIKIETAILRNSKHFWERVLGIDGLQLLSAVTISLRYMEKDLRYPEKERYFSVLFRFSPLDPFWTGLYGTGAFLEEFARRTQSGTGAEVRRYPVGDSVGLAFSVEPVTKVIGPTVTQLATMLLKYQEEAHEFLIENAKADSLVRSFNLPPELSVPCEQYLIYFTQFLRDLGVEATAEIEHRASEVLFSVTPADKTVALDKIRHALDIYLGLVTSPIQNTALTVQNEIAIQRLESEILTLQGRIRLGMAELQLKDATIRKQETELELLRRVLASGWILPAPNQLEAEESASQSEPDPDREDLMGGLVSVKPLGFPGGQVNLPVLFRRMRDWFVEPDEEKD